MPKYIYMYTILKNCIHLSLQIFVIFENMCRDKISHLLKKFLDIFAKVPYNRCIQWEE